jgi:hypothetical protein
MDLDNGDRRAGKAPLGVDEHSFAEPVRLLSDYVRRHTGRGGHTEKGRPAKTRPRAR